MQLKVNEVKGVYRKLGMEEREGDHKRAYLYFKGKLILSTKLSHGSGDAKAPDKIRGDFKLNETDFRRLVECPLTKEEYINILKRKRFIQNNSN